MKIFNALLFVFMSLMAVEQTAAATADTTAILPTVGPRAGILCPDGAIDILLGTNIQTVVNAYPGATTFCIRAGVHSITSPVTPKTGNTFVGEYGAILDGTGWTTPTVWEDAAFRAHNQDIDDVTIRNLVIRNMPNRGIHAYQFQSDRWTIEFNEITATSIGVAVPNNSLIRNNYIHHNTKGAYSVYQSRNTTFDHNEMAYNGIEHKVTGTTNFTFRNNFVHHNTRDGIWYDADNTGSLIEGNTVEDNGGEGILVEISGQGIVRNNASRRNGGSGIFIATSRDVVAYNNTIEDNFRGIIYFLNCESVGKGVIGWDLRDDTVRDNIVKVGTGSGALANGLSPSLSSCSSEQVAPYLNGSKNLFFFSNAYYVPTITERYWRWGLGSSLMPWSQWQALGHDTAGSIQPASNYVPVAAPIISSIDSAIGTIGAAFSYEIIATNNADSFNATGLPPGLSINTATGLISGTPTAVGTFYVTISATNMSGAGAEVVTLTVDPAAPIITSSDAATATVGAAFSYQITASNSPTGFDAIGLPAGLSINTATGLVSGAPAAAGTSSVTLRATNASGTGTQVLALTVNSVADPAPVITSTDTATGTVAVAFGYQITATNSPTSFGAAGLPAGLSINTATGVILGSPTAAGTSNVTLSATNASGTGTQVLALTVNSVADPAPVITSADAATGTVGVAFGYQITATNSPVSFGATGLPAGLSINTATGVISGSPTAAGTSNVTLSATNASGTGTQVLALTVNPAAPVITSAGTATGTVGVAFSYQITATNSPTSFGAAGLPAGLSINTATGAISGSPTAAGTSNVTLSATNASGTGTQVLALTVNPAAPVITSADAATGTVGVAFGYQITATNSPTSFGAAGWPAGLSINTATGVISGSPTAAGTSNVTLSATNASGTGTQVLALTVNPAADPAPVITSAGTATGTVGVAFSYQITATNSPTSFGAAGLPAGLSINTATGVISGSPTAAGTSNVTLSATNASGTGTQVLALTVNPAAPVITSAGTATGTVGVAFSYQITATNSPTSFGAASLPAGLSINTATGVISGSPTAAGTSNVTLSATNASGTGTQVLALTVNSAAPVITSAGIGTGTVGVAFSYQITASNSPTSFNATGLPAGLSVKKPTGLISGTPTAAGTFNVTLSATNASGTGTKALTLTVNPAGPVITSALNASAIVNTNFSYQITATNGPTSFGATGLPSGLVVNAATGLISGKPTTNGTSNVTLKATNSAGTGTATLRLTVSRK